MLREPTPATDENPAQPYARVTLEVEIFLETEPGSDTPNGRELPYDYLAVRSVRDLSTQVLGKPGAVELLSQDGIDDLDPDTLLLPAVADALLASNSGSSTLGTSSPVMTQQQTTAVEDALRELDPEEETWPTGEQIEVIARALSMPKVDGCAAPTATNKTPEFYSLPADKLVEGLSTDDGQDIVSVTIQDNNVTAEVYTPRPDNLELDEHNRDNSEMRIYNTADDVDLAIFPDTKVDGRRLTC